MNIGRWPANGSPSSCAIASLVPRFNTPTNCAITAVRVASFPRLLLEGPRGGQSRCREQIGFDGAHCALIGREFVCVNDGNLRKAIGPQPCRAFAAPRWPTGVKTRRNSHWGAGHFGSGFCRSSAGNYETRERLLMLLVHLPHEFLRAIQPGQTEIVEHRFFSKWRWPALQHRETLRIFDLTV